MSTVRREGRQSVVFEDPPVILGSAAIGGPFEGQGPLADSFDQVAEDELLGASSFERAECLFLERAVELALKKAHLTAQQIQHFLAGDLLDQMVTSNFAARRLGIPYWGIYGACSTSALGLQLGAMLVAGELAEYVVSATASHHLAAERQYRFPVELGVQRNPTAQWTATGGSAFVLGRGKNGVRLTAATVGVVQDLGLKDPNNMGAAMAPAAADTLSHHFEDLGTKPADYDLILTGDLGRVGHPLAREILKEHHLDLGEHFDDCGIMLYRPQQDVHAGGSGTACSGMVAASWLQHRLQSGELRRVLFVATGALHSPTTYQQGESIPCVAQAIVLEAAQEAKR